MSSSERLPAWAERTEEGRIRCSVCGNEADELPVKHDCIYSNSLVADGGRNVDGSDRLVLDVVVRENTRSETYSDFETLFREQFGAAYDEVEINVSGDGIIRTDGGTHESDSERIPVQEQVDWANDCNDLRILAKSAEAAVSREEYRKAHEKLTELSNRLERVREEYPRYVHAHQEAGRDV